MLPKLKVKVYFYHLFMLSIVMLLCFYLVYRDMKRIENNVLNIYNKVGEMEKINKKILPKINELLIAEQLENEVCVNTPVTETFVNNDVCVVGHNLDNENKSSFQVDEQKVDNFMETIVNLNVEEKTVEDNEVTIETVETETSQNNIENNNEEEDNDEEEDNEEEKNNKDVDDVMNLVDSLENEESEDLTLLDEKDLLEKTNTELKSFLKSKNLPNVGNKKKLVEAILNLNKN
jgi:hypothetical protein